jgi:hypothetical protein
MRKKVSAAAAGLLPLGRHRAVALHTSLGGMAGRVDARSTTSAVRLRVPASLVLIGSGVPATPIAEHFAPT